MMKLQGTEAGTQLSGAPYPREIHVFVTTACNLRCSICGQWGRSGLYTEQRVRPPTSLMPLDVIRRLVEDAEDHEAHLRCYLMGGEPFLHPDIFEIIELLRASKGCSYIDVNTNATRRLDQVGCERLVDTGIDAVAFSLDGPSEVINDTARGRGVFDAVCSSIRELANARTRKRSPTPKIVVVFTIQAHNYRAIAKTVRFLDTLPIDSAFVQMPYYLSLAEGIESVEAVQAATGITFDAWRGFLNKDLFAGIDPLRLERELREVGAMNPSFALGLNPVGFSSRQRAAFFSERWVEMVRDRVCPKLEFRTNLLPNGNVVPCTELSDLIVGNLYENRLSEIWTGVKYARFRGLLARGFLGMCHRCCDWGDEST